MGIDIDKDELAFFPVLYWPVREDVSRSLTRPSPKSMPS